MTLLGGRWKTIARHTAAKVPTFHLGEKMWARMACSVEHPAKLVELEHQRLDANRISQECPSPLLAMIRRVEIRKLPDTDKFGTLPD